MKLQFLSLSLPFSLSQASLRDQISIFYLIHRTNDVFIHKLMCICEAVFKENSVGFFVSLISSPLPSKINILLNSNNLSFT